MVRCSVDGAPARLVCEAQTPLSMCAIDVCSIPAASVADAQHASGYDIKVVDRRDGSYLLSRVQVKSVFCWLAQRAAGPFTLTVTL
jgi:hypothetical protein